MEPRPRPNALSTPQEILGLSSSYSREIARIARPPSPSQPGQLLRGQLRGDQPPLPRGSPGSSDQSVPDARRLGEGAVRGLQHTVCLGSFRGRRAGEDGAAPAEARADLRAVTVLLRTSLPAVPSPLLIPRSPSFFRFNNPGCIVPLNQTICVRALRSGREAVKAVRTGALCPRPVPGVSRRPGEKCRVPGGSASGRALLGLKLPVHRGEGPRAEAGTAQARGPLPAGRHCAHPSGLTVPGTLGPSASTEEPGNSSQQRAAPR